jgi:hypothetical protein
MPSEAKLCPIEFGTSRSGQARVHHGPVEASGRYPQAVALTVRARQVLARASVVTASLALGLLAYAAVHSAKNQFHYGCPGPRQPSVEFFAGLALLGIGLATGAAPVLWPREDRLDAERAWGLLIVALAIVPAVLAFAFMGEMTCGLD